MFVACFASGQSQDWQWSTPNIESLSIQNAGINYSFVTDSAITAVVIKSNIGGSFYWRNEGKKVLIPLDPDVEANTYFISLPNPRNEIEIESEINEYQLYLIHSGIPPQIRDMARFVVPSTSECGEEPAYIAQSEWRSGLPDPSYTRSFHMVNHNIIHHSAGANSNTNYTQVVRDIYLYHTQINGWSDIGYNYLIAQNGLLFAGRDPGTGDQNLVKGAHFCGKNTGTLGICLLGNYETVDPTSETWNSLTSFLTYALITLEIDPLEDGEHEGNPLGTIAGHRDGCATLCPGENVYRRIEELKTSIDEKIVNCNSSVAVATPILFPNPIDLNQSIQIDFEGEISKFYLLDYSGKTIQTSNTELNTVNVLPGLYLVKLVAKDNTYTKKLVVIPKD